MNNQLANPNDPEDEAMNENLFLLANGFSSFVNTNNDLLGIVYTQCQINSELDVKYSTLVGIDPRFRTLMNIYLMPLCPVDPKDPNHDCLQHLSNSMIYKSVSYYPNIYVPNLATANLTKDPIVCIGAEINGQDEILGYIIHKNGQITETHVGEQRVTNSQNPIIIFNNGTDHIETGFDAGFSSQSIITPTVQGVDRRYQWSEYKIYPGYRYENIGASEVKYYVTFYQQNGSPLTGTGYGNTGQALLLLDHISANDVNNGTLFTSNQDVLGANLADINALNWKYMYVTVYENDWWVTRKNVQWQDWGNNVVNPSPPFLHKCRMKYSNEWYCNTIVKLNQTSWWPGIGSAVVFGGSKMFLKITRVNP